MALAILLSSDDLVSLFRFGGATLKSVTPLFTTHNQANSSTARTITFFSGQLSHTSPNRRQLLLLPASY